MRVFRYRELKPVVEDCKKEGIPRDEVVDAVMIDSDQDVNWEDFNQAIEDVYGKEEV